MYRCRRRARWPVASELIVCLATSALICRGPGTTGVTHPTFDFKYLKFLASMV